MRTRVLLFFAFAMALGLAADSETDKPKEENKPSPEAGKESDAAEVEDKPREEDLPNEEADRNAHYFTQETLKEMQQLEKYKNNRLWACSLLTVCKMADEQVLSFIIG
eukprot:TRINITY_DN13249_c0_g1_i2.p1 TRINITY_DN13249_c0_g1~~TRINITY_DN13249_c0_g1_i2.p1  ORF type:complete len:108 (+),score=40.59 TRINITY_DN13249_c0_g1_i2:75-398(+)